MAEGTLGRIALVFGPHRTWDAPRNFPTGLGIIAAVLRQAGYHVHVIEVKAERLSREAVMSRLACFDPDVVCFGGLITTYRYAKWLIGAVKRWRPEMPVVLGGGLASSVPRLLLTRTLADVVVIGEGERTVLELLPPLMAGDPLDEVAGIAFRDQGEIHFTPPRPLIENLDEVPFPAWDLFPMEEYLKYPVVGLGRDMDLITSRGCPHRCTYCYQVFGRRFRARSAENIVEEIRQLDERYGLDFVSFQDDCFVVDRRRVYEFCDLIERSGLRIKWSCCGRVNLVDEEMLRRMKEAGCVSVSFGIESGSQEVLDHYRKGVRVEQAEEAVRLVRKVGLRCPTSFMLGAPIETRDTAMETVRFCQRLGIPLSAVMFTTPYPGTPLYEEARAAGRIHDEEAYIESLGDCVDFTVNLTGMSDEELQALREEMIRLVRAGIAPEDPVRRERFERALYGDELYEKGLVQLSRPAERAHRAQHGFNEECPALEREGDGGEGGGEPLRLRPTG